ncbi:MAG: dihydroneopterin triphosphate diphosphatase [Neisseria sp.]|nr:dihydroneopterin triphosphate diphosphatase [Neisseria sp.]
MNNNKPKPLKNPISVLVVLHDPNGDILLLERADKADFWQSVTGSVETGETPFQTALREIAEETGIVLTPEQLHDWHYSSVYEIYPHWRHRYPAGVSENLEHVFSACIARDAVLDLTEHTAYQWLPAEQAAKLAFSPSNQEAILRLSEQRKLAHSSKS